MTIASETARMEYAGNDSVTTFPYSFKIVDETHLAVYLTETADPTNEVLQVLNTDYTVTGAGDDSGGDVEMVTPPPTGYQLTIIRDVPFIQETDLGNKGPWLPSVHESAFDYLTMLCQQLAERIDRCFQAGVGIEETPAEFIERLSDAVLSAEAAQGAAETAQAAAEAAQGAAETAQGAAETAQGAAETAQTAAEAAASASSMAVPCGRLTLTTAVPVTTADVTAAATVYFTPFKGNIIALYGGAGWRPYEFAELTLSLAGYTADKNFDIFCYPDVSGPALESCEWTDDTTRATALAMQDGVLVKSGAPTRRYLGTIRTTGTIGQCEDSISKRFVWNYYNRCSRAMHVFESTSHYYATATWRAWNNTASAATQVYFVIGVVEDSMRWSAQGTIDESNSGMVGAALDGVTPSAYGPASTAAAADEYVIDAAVLPAASISAGYHYMQLCEKGNNNLDFDDGRLQAEVKG